MKRNPAVEARFRWATTGELIEELWARAQESSILRLDTSDRPVKEAFYFCARCSKDLGIEPEEESA